MAGDYVIQNNGVAAMYLKRIGEYRAQASACRARAETEVNKSAAARWSKAADEWTRMADELERRHNLKP